MAFFGMAILPVGITMYYNQLLLQVFEEHGLGSLRRLLKVSHSASNNFFFNNQQNKKAIKRKALHEGDGTIHQAEEKLHRKTILKETRALPDGSQP